MGKKVGSGSNLAKRAIHAQESRTGDELRIQILQAIEVYCHEHGRPPTIREIGAAVGIARPDMWPITWMCSWSRAR